MLCRQDESKELHRFSVKPQDQSQAETFTLLHCKNCGLQYLTPALSLEELQSRFGHLINLETSDLRQGPELPWAEAFSRLSYWWLFERNDFLHALLTIIRWPFLLLGKGFWSLQAYKSGPGRLLEVGWGIEPSAATNFDNGWQVVSLAIAGDNKTLDTSEPKSFKREDGSSLDVLPGGLESSLKDAGFPARYFDVVHLNFPLGSVPNPRYWLIELLRSVKDSGYLAIEANVHTVLESGIWRADWCHHRIPWNHYEFSIDTIGRLLAECGWELSRVHHKVSPSIWVDSLENRLRRLDRLRFLQKSIRDQRWLWLSLFALPSIITRFLHQSGSVTLYCQKKNMRVLKIEETAWAAAEGAV